MPRRRHHAGLREDLPRLVGGSAEIRTPLTLGAGARLDWLPQETILFDGARLSRRLDADLAPDAELLVVEADALRPRGARRDGRAPGSSPTAGASASEGRLIFADDSALRLGECRSLSQPAVLAGAGAMATILLVAEEPERHLEALREIVGEAGGVSAWNGKLLARLAAPDGAALRRVLIPLLAALRDGAPLPKLWRI